MEGISDIRMIGIDATRPPRIRKEPYIELYFKLTHKAPKKWCDDFNDQFSKINNPTKIDSKVGLVVETWVRKSEEITAQFELIKTNILSCNKNYIARIELEKNQAKNSESDSTNETSGAQQVLNTIVAGLKFDN